jgi:hypothetical protein
MCLHSLAEAKARGFRTMPSGDLYQCRGGAPVAVMRVCGGRTAALAFGHPTQRFVNALVMFRMV